MRAIKDQPDALHKREVIIRDAAQADAAAICRLLHELAEGEGRRCLQSESSVTHDLLAPESPMRLLVAEEAGHICGLVCYYAGYDIESASWGNHLADIIVTQACRNRGIGRRLMVEAARRTLAGQGEWLSWTVLRSNRQAQRFYKRLGGQAAAIRFMALGGNGLRVLAEI